MIRRLLISALLVSCPAEAAPKFVHSAEPKGLSVAAHCIITGGNFNENNCNIIKKYYVTEEYSKGTIVPPTEVSGQCIAGVLSADVGGNTFYGNHFPYAVLVVEQKPLLVASLDSGSVVVNKLSILDVNGNVIASIRDNKFIVRKDYIAENKLNSLEVLSKHGDNTVLRISFSAKCRINLYAILYDEDHLKVDIYPDSISTNDGMHRFSQNFSSGASACITKRMIDFCYVPPFQALRDDLR